MAAAKTRRIAKGASVNNTLVINIVFAAFFFAALFLPELGSNRGNKGEKNC